MTRRLTNVFPPAVQATKLGEGPATEFLARSVLHKDGPAHAALRRLLGRMLHRMPLGRVRLAAAELADRVLDAALERGSIEAVHDLGITVPLAVACELFDVPEDDRAEVSRWGLEAIKAFSVEVPHDERPGVHTALANLRAYVERALSGAGGIADIAGAASGEVDHDALVDNVVFLFVSGFTSSTHLIATLIAALVEYPEVQRDLRADPTLIDAAVDEALRWEAPLQHVARLVTAPIELAGTILRRGRVLHLLLGSANRDERQFEAPERFILPRRGAPHVSFGGGPHICLGASVGRAEAAAVVARLLQRSSELTPEGPAVRRPMQVFRSFESIPVRVAR